jgi:hypothetical protein
MKHPNNGPSFSKKPRKVAGGGKRFKARRAAQRASSRRKKSSLKVRRKRLRSHPSLGYLTKKARRGARKKARSL